jgi:hypothetical protein
MDTNISRFLPGSPEESAQKIEKLRALHQYYRDSLSQPSIRPAIPNVSPDLVNWALDPRNTDVSQLAEYLYALPPSEGVAEHELAFKLLLFTIVQANLASDCNNTYPEQTLPPNVAASIKRSLGRVLELHPANEYVVVCVQLLYRINEIEEVINLLESYPDVFANYPAVQALYGFIHTMFGNYAEGLRYLEPLGKLAPSARPPLVDLSLMTCQHFLGMRPEAPLSFGSLDEDSAELPRHIDKLARLNMIQPLESTPRPVVFVACDPNYFFKHACYLAYSIHATNVGKLDLHLHLYAPTPEVFREIERLRTRLAGLSIGVSAEYGPAPTRNPGSYYATARFIRAWQVLNHYQCEMCMMDADALFNGDWDAFTTKLPAGTEMVLARSSDSPFWERILAGFLYLKPAPLSKEFLGRVAQFILYNLERGKVIWFTDQIALSACDDLFTAEASAVCHIDYEVVIDTRHLPDTLCWMVTTRKTGHPQYDQARRRLELSYAGG